MIDIIEFFEFVASPAIAIIIQVILIWLNKHTVEDIDRLGLFKSILWIIITLSIFPSVFGMILQVSTAFSLVYISLGLFFLQIFINVEYILMDYKTKRR